MTNEAPNPNDECGRLIKSEQDPWQLVWQANEIDGRTRISRSCQTSWQGANATLVVNLAENLAFLPRKAAGDVA